MLIRDLFHKADVENVFNAYILIRPVFDDLDSHTILEKAMALKKLRKYINDACTQIDSCDVDIFAEPKTLFVIGRTRTAWGESYIQDLESFTIKDKDAVQAVKQNFTMWNDDGDVRLDFYGIGFIAIQVLVGYKIAKSSVSEQGIDVCCAVILHDLFFWGLTEEHRKESYKELINSLEEAEEDILNHGTISHDEIWAEFEKELLDEGSEDEKEHYQLEREYHNKVQIIERRYAENIMKQDHQRYIDVVRDEYSNRVN